MDRAQAGVSWAKRLLTDNARRQYGPEEPPATDTRIMSLLLPTQEADVTLVLHYNAERGRLEYEVVDTDGASSGLLEHAKGFESDHLVVILLGMMRAFYELASSVAEL